MLILNLLGFLIACIFLVKSSEFAVKSVSNIAKLLKIGEFLLSFIVVGFITSFPETTISIVSAVKKVPEIGFGTLLGSNIADLSLILGMIALVGKRIKINNKAILNSFLYLVLTLIPIILAYDGTISRKDGTILITTCILFVLHLFRRKHPFSKIVHHHKDKTLMQSIIVFIFSVVILYFSASYLIKFTEALSLELLIPTIFIALILIALGTCLPELLFALRSVSSHHAYLGLGEIMGSVIIDATLILGITALIQPIILERTTVLITGIFLILSVIMPLSIIRYRKGITQKDGFLLILVYILFVFVELSVKGIY